MDKDYHFSSKGQIAREIEKYPIKVKYIYNHTKYELWDILQKLNEGKQKEIPIHETVEELRKNYNILM